MSRGQWQCGLCLTQFSRMEHLRRHLRSHDNRRPYECGLCRRAFTRSDTMKRHERTCKAQLSCLDPGDKFSVRDNRNGSVAESLQSSAAVDEMGLLHDIPSSLDFTALDWLYTSQLSPDSIALAERLEYLEYFTSAKGMATFLDQETLKQRQRLVLEYEGHDNTKRDSGSFDSEQLCCPTDVFAYTIEPSVLHSDVNVDPLFPRTQEITRLLQSIISSKTNCDVIKLDWSDSTYNLCCAFFTPHNIRRFLEYFWSLWYPNCPIVHRPSFDPLTTPPAMLCVMIIIGACLSPHEEDGQRARTWLDSVEELVFSDEFHRDKPAQSAVNPAKNQSEWKKRRLECIQMTYLVCSLQKREGSTEAQVRIRRYRHAMMVTLARDIGFGSATHRSLGLETPSVSWWRRFIVEEELIRALTYVFLFDAALTIFHNSPPRMVVSELKMDMACPEPSFQAESAEECFVSMEQWKSSMLCREKSSISAVVRKICQSELDEIMVREFAQMGTLNMFTTVQALHSLTFHLQNSLIFESTLTPVQTGLDNWRRVWGARQPEDAHIPDHPRLIWKKIGFTRYAPEFWHLARIIVARIRNAANDQDSLPSAETGLPRYDHTDMMGVNGLITEYRRLNLGAT